MSVMAEDRVSAPFVPHTAHTVRLACRDRIGPQSRRDDRSLDTDSEASGVSLEIFLLLIDHP